jgi:hypothetical protein
MKSEKFQNTCSSGIFNNENVLVLLDPREAILRGAEFRGGYRRLIFAASNNDRHFASLVGKITGQAKRYLDAFTKDELETAIPFVISDKNYCLKTILERAKRVGCLLRYLIDDKMYKDRILAQDQYIASVKSENIDLHSVFNWDGMMKEKGKVPETIFMVSVKKSISDEESFFIAGSDEEDLDDDGEMEVDYVIDVGYDGEHIRDYGDMDIMIISPEIYLKLTKKSRAHLLTYLGKVNPGQLSEMGCAVEDLFWTDLQTKNFTMKCWKAGDNVGEFTKIMFEPERILYDASFNDLPEKVFGSEKPTVCRMTRAYKVIDCAATPSSVIQVTVSPPEEHELLVRPMKSLFLALGFMESDTNGNVSVTKKTIEKN